MQPLPTDFDVPFATFRFQPGLVAWRGSMAFTDADLAHALFTTGRAPGDQSNHGDASVWEFLHRTSLIPAYIRRRSAGRLVRSDLVQSLDRSELVGVSYALGMALTGVFCRTQLDVPFLMHVDRYASQYNVAFNTNSRRRADLIGSSTRGWLVAEAKGRSRSPESELRGKLEQQRRSVVSVAGQPPWLAVGCVAYFREPTEGIRVDAYDPPEDAEETVRYDEVTLDRYMFAYYLPFVRALDFGVETSETLHRNDTVASDFGPYGLTIGLIRPLVDLTTEYLSRRDVAGYAERVLTILADAANDDYGSTFPDGSILRTKWADALQITDFWTEH